MRGYGPGYAGAYKSFERAIEFIKSRGFKEVNGEWWGTWNDAGAKAYIHEGKVWVPVGNGRERRVTRFIVIFGA